MMGKFRRLSKNGKIKLLKILAAVTAVSVSPPLAGAVRGGLADGALIFADNFAEFVSDNVSGTPVLISGGSSSLLLYRPPAETADEPSEEAAAETAEEVIDETAQEEAPAAVQNANSEENEEAPVAATVLSRNISEITEDLSGYNSADGNIIRTTFSASMGTAFIDLERAGQVRNETEMSNAEIYAESLLKPEFKLELSGEPEVLIMHTHTTEAYQPDGEDYFDSEYISRTLDTDFNIVAVGAEIAKSLAENGITVIHDGSVHDSPEYGGAYDRSETTVLNILKEFPSVKVVLDVHRDAIEENGSRVAAVTEVGGEKAAQVMIISAADDGTYNIPEHMKNFRLASLLQQQMEEDYPGITRPVLFQYCHYNQQLTTGSLLIEVGSHGNSLAQAKYTGYLIGKSIAKALLSYI